MRPTVKPQSALRTPLNTLLGTEASVRVLRVLTESSAPISSGDLAKRAQLDASGVRRTLKALLNVGIVERIGTGRQGQAQLRKGHPLARPLKALFDAERHRVEMVFDSIRSAAGRLTQPPQSVWIEGPVATAGDRMGDPVMLGLLASAGELQELTESLRTMVGPLERTQDVTIELRGRTKADLLTLPARERQRLGEAIALLGPPPTAFLPPESPRRRGEARPTRTHADHDYRLRALASAIADKLRDDPTLADRARAYVRKRLRKASPREQKELREWDQILRTMSTPRLRQFLTDPGPRASRLRQTLPFVGALTPQERKRVLSEVGQ